MATGLRGRNVSMTVGGATLNGVINKAISISNSEVDVTDDQSEGFRELLNSGGVKSLDLSITGTIKDYELANTMFASTQAMACSINLGDGTTTESNLAFNAFMSSFEFSGDANERLDYSATLLSSGTITFTAGT